jgi:nucleoside-diphosphate-sugar epimerase
LRVLVTGASGFVGREFCRVARRQGMVVRECRRSLSSDPSVECVQIDLLSIMDCSAALQGVDVVVHLAARVHQMQERVGQGEAAYREMNVNASRRLIQQSAQMGVRRFVFVSSIKVNGECSYGRPITENDISAPIDAYGRSKLEAEQELKRLAEISGMEWVVIRPPLVYGAGVKGNFFRLLRQVQQGFPIPAGEAPRSYVNVWNLVDLILLCCTHPAAANQLFLAEDVTMSTTGLVRGLAKAMGKSPRLVFLPQLVLQISMKLPILGPVLMRLCGEFQISSVKARTLLGWQPVITVDEALRRTAVQYLRQCGE